MTALRTSPNFSFQTVAAASRSSARTKARFREKVPSVHANCGHNGGGTTRPAQSTRPEPSSNPSFLVRTECGNRQFHRPYRCADPPVAGDHMVDVQQDARRKLHGAAGFCAMNPVNCGPEGDEIL